MTGRRKQRRSYCQPEPPPTFPIVVINSFFVSISSFGDTFSQQNLHELDVIMRYTYAILQQQRTCSLTLPSTATRSRVPRQETALPLRPWHRTWSNENQIEKNNRTTALGRVRTCLVLNKLSNIAVPSMIRFFTMTSLSEFVVPSVSASSSCFSRISPSAASNWVFANSHWHLKTAT